MFDSSAPGIGTKVYAIFSSISVELITVLVGVDMRAKIILISSRTTLIVFTVNAVVLVATLSAVNAKLDINESSTVSTMEATAVVLIKELFCTLSKTPYCSERRCIDGIEVGTTIGLVLGNVDGRIDGCTEGR